MEYYSATKKKKILPVAATWVNLEGIMLSVMGETKKFVGIEHTRWEVTSVQSQLRRWSWSWKLRYRLFRGLLEYDRGQYVRGQRLTS